MSTYFIFLSLDKEQQKSFINGAYDNLPLTISLFWNNIEIWNHIKYIIVVNLQQSIRSIESHQEGAEQINSCGWIELTKET